MIDVIEVGNSDLRCEFGCWSATTVGRALRGILDRADASDSAKVEQIVAHVEGEGLRAPRAPVEPAVGRDDIHLVCNQAISW